MRIGMLCLLTIGLVFAAFKYDPTGFLCLVAFTPYFAWLEFDIARPDPKR